MAFRSVGEHGQAAAVAEIPEAFALRRVRVQDSNAVRWQQLCEEPCFGGQIARHRVVVVEVILTEIRKEGGARRDAVQAELVESMARSFEDEVVDTVLSQVGEAGMEFDGVGRGEALGRAVAGRDQSQGAETGGRNVLQGPDLSAEIGDGGLAAGPGHCGDAGRLLLVKRSGQSRQRPSRVGRRYQCDLFRGVFGYRRTLGREDSRGPLRKGFADEVATVGVCAL